MMKSRCIESFRMILFIGMAVGTSQISSAAQQEPAKWIAADLESAQHIVARFSGEAPQSLPPDALHIEPARAIDSIRAEGEALHIYCEPVDLQQNYRLRIDGFGEMPLRHAGILDAFFSRKPLGCIVENGETVFRIFSPRALSVELELFSDCEQPQGERHAMKKDADGVSELRLPGELYGRHYVYRIDGPSGAGEMFDPKRAIADPYSRAVCTRNHYLHQGRTVILRDDFDWEGDDFLNYDWRDLIILEAHVRDLTAHPSAGLPDSLRGTYLGMLDPNTPGGLNYLKDLGVNAVEFLPLQDFGNIEVPFKDPDAPVFNTWNPYARNHWGYMTSYFFAPESYYATGASLQPGGVCGADGRAVREFKQVVKTLHQNGIAVILDVVYNHVAQYDQNCFKLADKKYYFRLKPDLSFESRSGCGNDFKTERPMARRLIVDSILYWMKNYHIDGFRFDLATLLDWKTVDAITRAARQVNPDVILIAEPWGGGGYAPAEFSKHGWAAWNDRFRNSIKGQNPKDGLGFLFGRWQGNTRVRDLRNAFMGTLAARGGLFQESRHAVNYLESHDDHTLGDFIRLALGDADEETVIEDVDAHAVLSPQQLRLNRFAVLCLLVSQGPVMLAQGQDWARSKVIAPTEAPDPRVGRIDHNSYEKDNETNWLNWQHRERNRALVDYYRGLIALRRAHPAFRRATPQAFRFLRGSAGLQQAFRLLKKFTGDAADFIVMLNGEPQRAAVFTLPPGRWQVVVDAQRAGPRALISAEGGTRIVVPPTSGMVFRESPGF